MPRPLTHDRPSERVPPIPPAWVAQHTLAKWRCKELASEHGSEGFVLSRLGVGSFLFCTVKFWRNCPGLKSQFSALDALLDMRVNAADCAYCAHSELIP